MRELHAEGCTSERARQILRDETEGVNGCFNPSVAQYNAQLRALGLWTYQKRRGNSGPGELGSCNELREEDVSSPQQCLFFGGADDNQKVGHNTSLSRMAFI